MPSQKDGASNQMIRQVVSKQLSILSKPVCLGLKLTVSTRKLPHGTGKLIAKLWQIQSVKMKQVVVL